MRGWRTVLAVFLALAAIVVWRETVSVAASREGDPLAAWERFSRSGEADTLLAWLRCVMREELTGERCAIPGKRALPSFHGRLGIFITLKTKNTVRGCYGAFDHVGDDFSALAREYVRGALFSDPRAVPLGPGEVDAARIIVTIADRPTAIRSINMLDIKRYGVIITDESDGAVVYVPAEIRSVAHLKKRLAGVRIAQIAAFRAITIREQTR